ncbi:N-acetylglucosaminyltransferase II [Trinorchestia longiramus]|nr:N-acetylglucosaminyltransferase II [Trinorchestia longiramus]
MVLQVFYPHTLQLHPTSFPGHSQGDCPRDTDRKIARQVQCRGNPDLYGHYREPRYTQTKHHWWWKANKVFDSVLAPVNHTGLVLFLEEDHYVSEDLLHMLSLLSAALPHACPHCNLLTLGNYLKNYNWPGDAKKVEISPWLSSKHNMGFAFNRTTWRQIKACGEGFCTHDDYNWDWSLQHVSNTCLKQRLYTMVLRAPRVFHIGECGVHHKKKDCSSKLVLNKVYRTLQVGRRALFPLKLIIVQAPPKKVKKHNGNGGWGDHRDQELCKAFLTSTGLFSPLVLEPTPPDTALLQPTNHTSVHSVLRPTNSSALGLLRRDIFPDILPKMKNSSAKTQDVRRPWRSGDEQTLREIPGQEAQSTELRAQNQRPNKMKRSGREPGARVSNILKQPKVITVSYDVPSGTVTQSPASDAAAVPHYLDPRHPLNPTHYRGAQLLGHVQDPTAQMLRGGMGRQTFMPGIVLAALSQHGSLPTSSWMKRTPGDSSNPAQRVAALPPGLSAEMLSLQDTRDDARAAITYEEGQDMRVHRRSIS